MHHRILAFLRRHVSPARFGRHGPGRRGPSLTVLSLAAGALVVAGCSGDTGFEPITHLPRELTAAELRVIDGSNTFAFDLLREVAAASDSANVFLSPLSASMALGMTMAGAEGETWSQMRDVLGFGGLEEREINESYRDLIRLLLELDPQVRMGLGNAIWADRQVHLLPEFRERTAEYFSATTRTVDFTDPATLEEINDWVAEVTNGRIDRLLDGIPRDILMYLVNAVYFNGDWRTQFKPSRTARAPFTRADGSTVEVDMMAGEVGYRILSANGVRGVELPYGGGAFAGVAILPPAEVGIDAFVAGLEKGDWDVWMAAFDAAAETEDLSREGMLVRFPKFEMEWGDSLQAALRALGMTDALDPHVADFSGMTGGRDLFIDHVLQKTFLKVDERGTEAAAATAVAMGPTSAPPTLDFDRPFIFAIRERLTGAILFIGAIGDPS